MSIICHLPCWTPMERPPAACMLTVIAARTTSRRARRYTTMTSSTGACVTVSCGIALDIPSGFEKDLQRGRQPQVNAILDAAVPFRAETARSYVESAHGQYEARLRETKGTPSCRQSDEGRGPRALQSGLQEHLRHGSRRHHAAPHPHPEHAHRAQRGARKGARVNRQFLRRARDPHGISSLASSFPMWPSRSFSSRPSSRSPS